MATNNSQQNNFTEQFTNVLQQRHISYLQNIGLLMPQTQNPEELFVWKELYSILARGHYRELISTENVFKFAQIFSNLDLEKQHKYLEVLGDKFQESNIGYETTINIASKLYSTNNSIESIRNKLPEPVKIIYDYIIYSRLSGEEVDENLINEAIYELSPEGQAELAAANIFQTIEKTKRKPLNAGRIDGQSQYNKVFTKEQLAKVLEEGQEIKPNQPSTTAQNPTNQDDFLIQKPEPKIVTPGIRTLPKKQPSQSTYTNSQQNFAPQPIQQPVQNYPRQNFTPAQQTPNQNYPQQIRRSPLPRTVMNTRSVPRAIRPSVPQNRPSQSIVQPSRTQPQTPGFSKTVHGLDD
jgi:hypothetical protein